ncbi:hypothetical protein, partial [Anaerotignum lactatifermentans]|uniref:hypothetical protein n=1 Tax=Anaerotignum lactatifermentans TaxID=160404 RepID=UPI003AB47687
GLATCNLQTTSPSGFLNNFNLKILSNFLGSVQCKGIRLFYIYLSIILENLLSHWIMEPKETGGLWKKEIMTVFPSKKSVIFSVRKEVTGVMTHSTSVTFISRKHESFFYRNHIMTG